MIKRRLSSIYSYHQVMNFTSNFKISFLDRFFEIFEKYDGYKLGHVKLKRPKQLQEILDIARFLLSEIHTKSHAEIEEKESKLEQLKNVLEMYGHFSGINRKVQMKYQPKGRPRGSSSDDGKFLYCFSTKLTTR